MKNKIFLTFSLPFILMGCSSLNGPHHKLESSTSVLGMNQARVYFLRETDSIKGPSIDIFVDNNFISSLNKGEYQVSPVCAVNSKIAVDFNEKDHFADRKASLDFNFLPNEDNFVSLYQNKYHQLELKKIPPQLGKQLIQQMRKNTHHLVRHPYQTECKAAKLENVNISLESLFTFDQADPAYLLKASQKSVADLLYQIQRKNIQINQIKIVGYSDPQGSAIYNQQLSWQRANNIKTLLQQAGINAPIIVKGEGEKGLKVNNCASKYPHQPTQRKSCNQPNRRVEIFIYGKQFN